MKRTVLRMAFLLGAIFAVLFALLLTFGVVAGSRNLAGSLSGMIRIPFVLAAAWALFAAFRRFGNPAEALPAMADLAGPAPIAALRAFYVAKDLGRAAPVSRPDNPYAAINNDDLLDVCSKLSPKFPPERVEALFATVKQRVEAAYLSDGRLIPAALRKLKPQPAVAGSLCARHPEIAARITCLRCGTFACDACTADRKHCEACLALLIPA